jgi:hypothetical protein
MEIDEFRVCEVSYKASGSNDGVGCATVSVDPGI